MANCKGFGRQRAWLNYSTISAGGNKIMRNFIQKIRCPGGELNRAPPDYKSGALLLYQLSEWCRIIWYIRAKISENLLHPHRQGRRETHAEKILTVYSLIFFMEVIGNIVEFWVVTPLILQADTYVSEAFAVQLFRLNIYINVTIPEPTKFNPEYGGSMFLWKVHISLQDYTCHNPQDDNFHFYAPI